MSVGEPTPRNPIWHIEFEAAEVIQRRRDATLAPFKQHKATLIAQLRKANACGPRSKSFEAEKPWRRLTELADWYFWQQNHKPMSPSDRVKRLRRLARVLDQARGMLYDAIRDPVGHDLLKALFEEANEPPASVVNGDSSVLTRITDEMENAVASLVRLETAARRAAEMVQTAPGRPKGTSVLPPDYIIALAGVYRESTGLQPGKGDGPFARFVYKFLTALGQKYVVYDSVVASIKDSFGTVRP